MPVNPGVFVEIPAAASVQSRFTLGQQQQNTPGMFISSVGKRFIVTCQSGQDIVPLTQYVTVFRSVDGGSGWSESDQANRKQLPDSIVACAAATNGFRSQSTVQVGDVLYVGHISWDFSLPPICAGLWPFSTPHYFVISRFNMITNLWMADLTTITDVNAPQIEAAQGAGSAFPDYHLIYRPSDGSFFVGYSVPELIGPVYYDHPVYKKYNAGWSAQVYLHGGALTAEDFYVGGVTVGAGNRLHWILHSRTLTVPTTEVFRLGAVTMTSADVIIPYVQADTWGPPSGQSTRFWVGAPVVRVAGGVTEIAVAYSRDAATPCASEDLYWMRFTSTNAIAPGVAVILSLSTDFIGTCVGYHSFGLAYDPISDNYELWSINFPAKTMSRYVYSVAGASWAAGVLYT